MAKIGLAIQTYCLKPAAIIESAEKNPISNPAAVTGLILVILLYSPFDLISGERVRKYQ